VSIEGAQKILLGISGGIAAYKTPELVRRLVERGTTVQVVMTQAAASFVTPLSLQAVSGRPVRSALLAPEAEAGMDHIALARWADLILLAPATAHLIARLAHGLADDLLTTLVLASTAPVILAPAMNQQMWQHPATVENMRLLRDRGCRVLGPAEGAQACGETGPGRMLEPAEIAEQALAADAPTQTGGRLAGVPVLLTAGPTREAIDPVRYVGNRSSGKMGYALAAALTRAGAAVTLVSGPTALPCPQAVTRVQVESAAEMYSAVMARAGDCSLFIAAAAVADYRPALPLSAKLKKASDRLTLELVRNPDILAAVAALPSAPFTVGFAAETETLAAHATEKLQRKGLDMVAANLVGTAVGGFESDDNALLVLWPGGSRTLALMPKPALATALTELIAERYAASASG
jgi:phosphopantothenoylcysteine decarboxylase/phosphopantothenate--cysteine ligase